MTDGPEDAQAYVSRQSFAKVFGMGSDINTQATLSRLSRVHAYRHDRFANMLSSALATYVAKPLCQMHL